MKFKHFSDDVSNLDQNGEGTGVKKRRFLLKTSSFLFPYAVFMIMGFRAFFFLYFMKYHISLYNSLHPTFPDISLQRREGKDRGSPWGLARCLPGRHLQALRSFRDLVTHQECPEVRADLSQFSQNSCVFVKPLSGVCVWGGAEESLEGSREG